MPILLLIILLALSPSFLIAASSDDPPSLDEMVGQLLMVGFRGMDVSESDLIVQDIKERHLGGVILFDFDVPTGKAYRNIESAYQVRELVSRLKQYSDIPLFVAIDQEGGRVNRLKERYGFPKMTSHEYIGRINNADTTRYFAEVIAETLADLGINVNFAPVVDVNVNPQNPVIGRLERSFSKSSDGVIRHASIYINEHRNNGIIPTIKHFPGHGSAWNDSHYGMADVTETWKELELEPYRYFVENNMVDMIMSAHIFNENWDSNHPATLSKSVMTNLLRDELGFSGVLVSDDMQMGAITDFYGLEQAIVLALNAGIDILVFANNSVYDPEITQKAVEIIKRNVQSGEISLERIRESYERVKRVKGKLK